MKSGGEQKFEQLKCHIGHTVCVNVIQMAHTHSESERGDFDEWWIVIWSV